MKLKVGDRLGDETGEWPAGHDERREGRYARVQKVGQPDVTEIRTWGAHERVGARRG